MKHQSLTPVEVAEQLQIAKNTVYELIKRGELPAYKVGRKVRIDASDLEAYKNRGKGQTVQPTSQSSPTVNHLSNYTSHKKSLIISGEASGLGILVSFLKNEMPAYSILHASSNSYLSLVDLYLERVNISSTNLWSSSTGQYNTPYTKLLLPGTPIIIIRLSKTIQGLYVQKGNPKNIHDWADFQRPSIKIAGREKGSSSCVLLEEKLRSLEIDPMKVSGYEHSLSSDILTATAVLEGKVDCAIGEYNTVKNIDNIDFIPLQESYDDLVIKKSDMSEVIYQVVFNILNQREFKKTISLTTYCDTSETGEIVYES